MTRLELAGLLDHSILKPEATEEQILAGADLVRQWASGFYCVQPSSVSIASAGLQVSGARVVSVVGFPHGMQVRVLWSSFAGVKHSCRFSCLRSAWGGSRSASPSSSCSSS